MGHEDSVEGVRPTGSPAPFQVRRSVKGGLHERRTVVLFLGLQADRCVQGCSSFLLIALSPAPSVVSTTIQTEVHMFRHVGRGASMVALFAALNLFFSTPGHLTGDDHDCVYDPPGGERGPSCCYCKEYAYHVFCTEAWGSRMEDYRENHDETAFCSSAVCPEQNPCPNGGGGN